MRKTPEKILVVRRKPKLLIYIRDYPKDYKTGEIHPNKLKTWIRFAEVAIEKRGRPYEEVIENVVKKCSGVKFKSDEKPKKVVSLRDYLLLKLQAIRKGIDPNVVDELVELSEEDKKKYREVLAPVFYRTKVGIVAETR